MGRISNKIAKLMAARQMTVKILSTKSGISLTYLYDILADKVKDGGISVNKLEQIAKALDSTVAEITLDTGFDTIKSLRDQMPREQLALVDAILSLKPDSWKREAILRMLGIERVSKTADKNKDTDAD